jgi:hypothetical protein
MFKAVISVYGSFLFGVTAGVIAVTRRFLLLLLRAIALVRKSSAVAGCCLSLLTFGLPIWAQSHAPLQYHGGPVLQSFRIYPLYYGNWSQADINAKQNFLNGLCAYLSGQNAPAFEQPMTRQYGVEQVTVAGAVTTTTPSYSPGRLTKADLLNIIHTNQMFGNLPAYGGATLIMVFPAHGYGLDNCNGCGYHSSESASAFWSVVPEDAGPTWELVTGHEVFEAAADPAVDNDPGWDEAVDGCDSRSFLTFPFGQIPGAADNTQGGTCSTTGYTSLGEYQDYGVSYERYRADYDRLWPQGWRLYTLQSFVLPDGTVCYNAVWRPGNDPEIQVYGWTYGDYRSKYDELWPEGWRLYILDAYVLPNGEVRYNAVWRLGNTGEIQDYGVSYAQYRSDYDRLWTQGWRLYILQSYVLPTGEVLYNAVWRPGDSGEIQVYGWTYADFRAKYDQLWTQGWRLYLLQSYVLPDGEVLYNAVWRPGNSAEIQVYGWRYADYRAEYDQLWTQGWRLYILQSYMLPNGQVLYNAVWRLGTRDRPL